MDWDPKSFLKRHDERIAKVRSLRNELEKINEENPRSDPEALFHQFYLSEIRYYQTQLQSKYVQYLKTCDAIRSKSLLALEPYAFKELLDQGTQSNYQLQTQGTQTTTTSTHVSTQTDVLPIPTVVSEPKVVEQPRLFLEELKDLNQKLAQNVVSNASVSESKASTLVPSATVDSTQAAPVNFVKSTSPLFHFGPHPSSAPASPLILFPKNNASCLPSPIILFHST